MINASDKTEPAGSPFHIVRPLLPRLLFLPEFGHYRVTAGGIEISIVRRCEEDADRTRLRLRLPLRAPLTLMESHRNHNKRDRTVNRQNECQRGTRRHGRLGGFIAGRLSNRSGGGDDRVGDRSRTAGTRAVCRGRYIPACL